MLSTDRLMSTFEVQPAVLRLRSLLIYLGSGVAVSVALAFYLGSQYHPYESYEAPVASVSSEYRLGLTYLLASLVTLNLFTCNWLFERTVKRL